MNYKTGDKVKVWDDERSSWKFGFTLIGYDTTFRPHKFWVKNKATQYVECYNCIDSDDECKFKYGEKLEFSNDEKFQKPITGQFWGYSKDAKFKYCCMFSNNNMEAFKFARYIEEDEHEWVETPPIKPVIKYWDTNSTNSRILNRRKRLDLIEMRLDIIENMLKEI